MGYKDVNVNVGGNNNNYPQTYKTVILKPNIPLGDQLTEENTIYVVKWDFEIGMNKIYGSFDFSSGGTMVIDGVTYYWSILVSGKDGNTFNLCDNTVFFCQMHSDVLIPERSMTLNKDEAIRIASPLNTYHEKAYYTEGNVVIIPDNCILRFEGGSISNGMLVGNDTILVYIEEDKSLHNIEYMGTFRHVAGISKPSILDGVFENNIINNPFFLSSEYWETTNCTIDNKLIINGEGEATGINAGASSYASQVHPLFSKHRYLVACYARVTEVHHAIKANSTSFYGRYGIGFRVKDDTPVANKGIYTLNLDFIGNREKSDFIPIIYILDVYNDANPTISFGEIYTGNGYIKGEILHAGLYDITGLNSGVPNYKDFYFAYKDYVEKRLNYKSSYQELKYPDSMTDLAFIEEMNAKAKYMYMNNTTFGTTSGIFAQRDAYNDNTTYMTVLQPSSVETGKMIVPGDGRIADNAATNVYTYNNITSKNLYFVKNLRIQTPNVVVYVYFYKDNGTKFVYESYKNKALYERVFGEKTRMYKDITTYSKNAYEYKNNTENVYSGTHDNKNISYDVDLSEMINVPDGVTQIKLMSDNGSSAPGILYTPQLVCLSEAPINNSSIAIDAGYYDYLAFRIKDTITTAKDICILNGIAITDRKLQEIWNNQRSDLTMYAEGEISESLTGVQMSRTDSDFNNKFFRIYGKGGSYRSLTLNRNTPNERSVTRDIAFGSCVKDRSTDRWFAISLARFDYRRAASTPEEQDLIKGHSLPNYNDVTALPSDEGLNNALQAADPTLYAAIQTAAQNNDFVTVSDEVLQLYYPEIFDRKVLNNSNNNTYEALINWYKEDYIAVIAKNNTTAETDVLPRTGYKGITYRVDNWDSTEYNLSYYSEYIWNGKEYILQSVEQYTWSKGSGYVSVVATVETQSIEDVLPAVGDTSKHYHISNWDGVRYNENKYAEYDWREYADPSNNRYVRTNITKLGKDYSNFNPDTDLDWDCCAVCEVYPDMPFVYNEVGGTNLRSGTYGIYESTLIKKYSKVRGKNINMAIHPMSITKTMTILTAMQYMNLSDYIEYKEGNYVSGSGYFFNYGEYYTLRDCIIYLLAASDNPIATNIANQVGQKILEARYGK